MGSSYNSILSISPAETSLKGQFSLSTNTTLALLSIKRPCKSSLIDKTGLVTDVIYTHPSLFFSYSTCNTSEIGVQGSKRRASRKIEFEMIELQ